LLDARIKSAHEGKLFAIEFNPEAFMAGLDPAIQNPCRSLAAGSWRGATSFDALLPSSNRLRTRAKPCLRLPPLQVGAQRRSKTLGTRIGRRL
jgi:hypothetical protein